MNVGINQTAILYIAHVVVKEMIASINVFQSVLNLKSNVIHYRRQALKLLNYNTVPVMLIVKFSWTLVITSFSLGAIRQRLHVYTRKSQITKKPKYHISRYIETAIWIHLTKFVLWRSFKKCLVPEVDFPQLQCFPYTQHNTMSYDNPHSVKMDVNEVAWKHRDDIVRQDHGFRVENGFIHRCYLLLKHKSPKELKSLGMTKNYRLADLKWVEHVKKPDCISNYQEIVNWHWWKIRRYVQNCSMPYRNTKVCVWYWRKSRWDTHHGTLGDYSPFFNQIC